MAQYINLVRKTNSNTYTEIYVKQNLPREILFTLETTGWSNTTPPSKNVEIQGITSNTVGVVGVSRSATNAEWQAAQYGQLRVTDQGANSITITAYGVKPAISIPCVLTCSSNAKLTDSGTVVGS